MKVLCLLLILSVAVVYQAEAGWWRRAVDFVGNAASTVVNVIRAATMIGKKHRRRALREVLDEDSVKEVDNLCYRQHINDLTTDGIPFEMVKITFEKVDSGGNPNDALDAAELDMFLNSMEVYKHCMEQQKDDQGGMSLAA